MENTPGQGRQVREGPEREHSFLQETGEEVWVSRQAIYGFCKKKGVERPKRPRGHQTEECLLCQKLIEISKKFHSEFISIHTIAKETGKLKAKYNYHLRILRDKGLVSQRFGRLRSKRLEEAYAIYFTKRLPIRTIGRKVGIKNFQSLIQTHRKLGWNVPPPLYVYNGEEKRRILSETQRRKQR
jgi:hypothetical protein